MSQAEVRLLTRDGTTTLAMGTCAISSDTTDRVTGFRYVSGTVSGLEWRRPVTVEAIASRMYLLELSNGLSFGARLTVEPGTTDPVRNASFTSVGPIEQMQPFVDDENADRASDVRR